MLEITAKFIRHLLGGLDIVINLELLKQENKDMKIKKLYIVAKCIEDTSQFPKTSIDIMEMLFRSIILLYRDNKEQCLERFSTVLEYYEENEENEGKLLTYSNLLKHTYDFFESHCAETFVNGSIIEMNQDIIKMI